MDSNRRGFLSTTAAAATLAVAGPLLGQTTRKPDSSAAPSPPTATASSAPGVPSDVKKIEIVNLRELEGAAQKILPAGSFGYIASAAGDEWTKRENEAAYKRLTIEPRYLTGHEKADMTTILLGAKISMPIVVTPMGGHGNAHASAEVGTAKGAHAAGTLIVVPSLSSVSLEEISQASPGPKWFQFYLPADRGLAKALLQRAKAASYLAVVLTIDAGGGSNRETNQRNQFTSWVPSGNYPGGRPANKSSLGWDDVAFVQQASELPVFVKGVLSPETAQMAVEHGCAGIQVSNHGGRQLDDVPASITVLPRIADAVAGRIPVIVDGGVRRGQDVFKALALGANAVAVGRPVMYGLALGGWMGVQAVLEHLQGEFEMTMRHAGAQSIAEISKRYLFT